LRCSLVATAAALAVLAIPQAQANHIETAGGGLGHDNTIPSGFGTSTTCVATGDGCLIVVNQLSGSGSSSGVGLRGVHSAFNGGNSAPFAAGVFGDNNSQDASAVGVYGRVASGGQPGSGSAGVRGDNGGVGQSNADTAGVYGYNNSVGYGVRGLSEYGDGLYAKTNSTISGTSGVYGVGNAPNTTGVAGSSDSGTGVQASSSSGTALQVNGRSRFTGQATFQNGVAVTGKATFSRSGLLTAPGGTSSLVKTGISLSASSYVLATMQTNTPGVSVQSAVPNPAASTITIHLNTTAPAGTKVAWFVVN
jgi:hypothetical protein